MSPVAAAVEAAPLDIVVPYTTPELTRLALRKAGELSAHMPSAIRVLRMQRVPFPLQLNQCPVSIESLRDQTGRIAQDTAATEVKIFLTRDPDETLMNELQPGSIIVIASKKRWWRTAQERLKQNCARRGHHVTLIYSR